MGIQVIDMTGKGIRRREYKKQLNRADVFRPTSDKIRNEILKGAFYGLDGNRKYKYGHKAPWVTKVKTGEWKKLSRPDSKNSSVVCDCTGFVTAVCKYAGVTSATRCGSYSKYKKALCSSGHLKKQSFHADSGKLQPGDVCVRTDGKDSQGRQRGHAWIYVGSKVTRKDVMAGAVEGTSTSDEERKQELAKKVLETARAQIGKTVYSHENITLARCDCVGFVRLVYLKVCGWDWKKKASSYPTNGAFSPGVWKLYYYFKDKYENLGKCKIKDLQPCDVLFYLRSGRQSHVAMYAGNGKIIHCTSSVGVQEKKMVSTSHANYDAAFRILDGSAITNSVSGDGTTAYDAGGAIVLTTIETLLSSDTYGWYKFNEEESEEERKAKERRAELSSFIDNIRFTPDGSLKNVPTDVQVSMMTTKSDRDFVFKPKLLAGKHSEAKLTSYPNLVETPFIELTFNGVTIGGYNNVGDKYPNYINSMTVQKMNGRINRYTFNLTYQVRPGEDPNFIDALISHTGYTNPLKIRYGDMSSPGMLFKEESAIITDVKSSDNVSSMTINYTIEALSSIISADQSYFNFRETTAKPSTVLNNVLYNMGEVSRQITNAFPAMKNPSFVNSQNLILTNDEEVTIGGAVNFTPLKYIGHVVSCMTNAAKDSSYFLTYHDSQNGAYFRTSEVSTTNTNILYEIDVGYPGDNFVTNFQLCDNIYWPLVYEYNGKIPKWNYEIDNNGNILSSKSNNLFSDNKFLNESLINSNWWKSVTEFPISAKLTLKGLTVPALLMTYIRVNTLFYGQNDIASGIYVVTDQTDTISGSGYSTTLTLLRVAN